MKPKCDNDYFMVGRNPIPDEDSSAVNDIDIDDCFKVGHSAITATDDGIYVIGKVKHDMDDAFKV